LSTVGSAKVSATILAAMAVLALAAGIGRALRLRRDNLWRS
jgi:hypothetical protein